MDDDLNFKIDPVTGSVKPVWSFSVQVVPKLRIAWTAMKTSVTSRLASREDRLAFAGAVVIFALFGSYYAAQQIAKGETAQISRDEMDAAFERGMEEERVQAEG